MKHQILNLILLLATAIAIPEIARAQLYDVPISTLADHASVVTEGKVRSKTSFWNTPRTCIYTQYQIEVHDVLKGRANSILEIVRLGGCVENDCQTLFPRLELGVGQEGVFFLRPFTKETLYSDLLYEVVSGPLGFISFEELDGRIVGANALRVYTNLNAEIYVPIAGRPKRSEHESIISHLPDAAPTITSFFPDTLAAGVNDTLTILGIDFGIAKGKVWFQNADQPPGIFMRGDNPDIAIWTDTLIKLVVPSVASIDSASKGVAGTGQFRIEANGGLIAQSAADIFIKYAYRNRRTLVDSIAYSMILTAPFPSKSGGYVFQLDTGFSSIPEAKNVFEKALRDWRCTTLVNFSIGNDTSIQVLARDTVNAIFWDTLDPGVLAQTFVDNSNCRDQNSGQFYYQVYGIDIAVSATDVFHVDTITNPAPTENDLYSILLHELGHGHLLQHVNRETSLMHRFITTGTTVRAIPAEIDEGALRIMDSSTVSHSPDCFTEMTRISAAECNVLGTPEDFDGGNSAIRIFPNPTANQVNIEISLARRTPHLSIEIVDLFGRIIQQKSLAHANPGTNIAVFDVRNYPSGYYLLRISGNRAAFQKPFIINR